MAQQPPLRPRPGLPAPRTHDEIRHPPMTQDEIRHRFCTGKVRFPTLAEAENIAKRQRTKWKLDERVHLSAYLCPYCHQFHIGRDNK